MGDKLRSLRSNLSVKVKTSIFKVFENKLPPINGNASSVEIIDWKKNPAVYDCYKKLFKEVEGTSEKYIVRIIKSVWPKKEKIPDPHAAWCVSIAQILLNPHIKYIQISEEKIQPIFEKNLVSNRIN